MDCLQCCESCCLCCSACGVLVSWVPDAFGCPTKFTPDGEHNSGVCPTCDEAAVHSAYMRYWMKCCYIPVIPLPSKRVWHCETCDWTTLLEEGGWQPKIKYGNESGGGVASQPSVSPNMKLSSQTERTSGAQRTSIPLNEVRGSNEHPSRTS